MAYIGECTRRAAHHHRQFPQLVVLEPQCAQVAKLLDFLWDVSNVVAVVGGQLRRV